MDSPVFGSSSKNPKMFKTNMNQADPSPDILNSQYILTVLTVQKNIRKMFATLSRYALNKKREGYLRIKYKENEEYFPVAAHNALEIGLMMDIQRKINAMVAVIRLEITKNQMMAWRSITYYNTIRSLGQERRVRLSNVDPRDDMRANSHRNKKRQDLKENSDQNLNDLPSQNKKLKSQIQKQQLQQQSFISKMKTLLDGHEKQRSKVQAKKKK